MYYSLPQPEGAEPNEEVISPNGQDMECRFHCGSRDNLLAPCFCSGTNKFICRPCLDSWRASDSNPKAFTHCTQCNFEYVLEPINENPVLERRRNLLYSLYLIRDAGLFIIVNQFIILAILIVIMMIDKNDWLYHTFPTCMQGHRILIYYIYALSFYIALIGLIGIAIALAGSCLGSPYHSSPGCCCYGFPDSSSGGAGDAGCFACLIVTFVFFLVCGIFIGIYTCCHILNHRAKYHKAKLWKEQQSKKYVVVDFNGREDELNV